MEYKFHELCELFPIMEDAELDELAEDIKAHGLHQPIVLLDNKILDGRNRYLAFIRTDLPRSALRIKGFDASKSPLEFVISQNLKRRHLSPTQKAVLALELLPKLEEEALERKELGGKHKENFPDLAKPLGQARDIAARAVGVNERYVSDAKRIAEQDYSGELIDKMRSGELGIQDALKIVGHKRPQAQPTRTRENEDTPKLTIIYDTERLITRWQDLLGKIYVGEENKEKTLSFIKQAIGVLERLLEGLEEIVDA